MREFNKLKSSLPLSEHELAKPLLERIAKGEFTADNIQKIADAFAGEDAVAWHPQQFMAGTIGKLFLDTVGEWSVKSFGIEKVGEFNKFMGALKTGQSLMLLGINPGYWINNTINNTISRMVTGVFGYDITNERARFYKRIGYYPERYSAGIGAAGADEYVHASFQFIEIISPMESPAYGAVVMGMKMHSNLKRA